MKRSLLLITISCFLIIVFSACGPAMIVTEAPQVEIKAPTPALPRTSTLPPTQTALPSTTPLPAVSIAPTETYLPTLELLPLKTMEPAFEVWDGQPTDPAESQPGFFFRVKFNPRVWGLTQDSYGQAALGHRFIGYCILAGGGVRGMSPGIQVEHSTRQIGPLYFEVNEVLLQGVRQFVTYQAQTADRTVFTSFQVNFVDEIDACLLDVEVVLATLISVPESQATPIP